MNIPKYQVGQVGHTRLPGVVGVNATESHFGVDAFKSASSSFRNLGNKTHQYLLKEKHKTDTIAARGALNNAQEESRNFMNGNIYNTTGKDALNSNNNAKKGLQDIVKKSKKDLTPDQSSMFDSYYDSIYNSHLSKASSHLNSQRDLLDKQTKYDQNIQILRDFEEGNMSPMDAKADYIANLRSVDPTTTPEQALNSFHSSVVNSLINRDPAAASEYFETNKKELHPEQYNKIESRIKQEVKTRKTILENEEKTKYNDYFESESDKAWKDPFNYKIPIEHLKAKDQSALLNLREKRIKDIYAEKGIGGAAKTDLKTYSTLINMSESDFKNANLLDKKYIDGLSSSDLRKQIERQAEIKKGTKKAKLDTEIKSLFNTHISGMTQFDTSGTKGSTTEEAGRRKAIAYQQFNKMFLDLPKEKQNQENALLIMNEQFVPETIDPWGWGNKKIVFGYEKPYLDDIYQDHINRTEKPERLKALGDALNYDSELNNYFIEGDGIRHYYNSDGTYQGAKKFRGKEKLSKRSNYRDKKQSNWINKLNN
jgi:hypothetical protein